MSTVIDVYEIPTQPDITIDSSQCDIATAVDHIIQKLLATEYLRETLSLCAE